MKTLSVLFCILVVTKEYYCYDREIHCNLNPNCDNCNTINTTLFYVKAIGETDLIHNIWDFSLGKPSILFAITDLNSTLKIGWNDTKPINITFSTQPKYSFGLIINKILEFNDVNDTGIYNPTDQTSIKFDLANTEWHRYAIVAEAEEALIRVKSNNFVNNGTIKFELNIFPYISYGFELPHLIHSANSSLVDIELENMTTNFKNSRYALEILLISTESNTEKSINVNKRKGLDDEHTPGIFEIIELITPETENKGDGGFVQFRPVSYTAKLRDVSTSTPVQISDMMRDDAKIPDNSTGQMFFDKINSRLLIEKMYVSFGGKGDGYYNRTKYNIWSFTVGYGLPPMEGFSLFVILIISIGLGVPAFLMIVGGIYVCCKRRNRASNQPEILIED